MDENPYQSPPLPDASTISNQEPAGLWRDRDLLVLRIRDPHFPPRCIKTNKFCDGSPTQLDVDWIPNHGMWLLMLGALGHVIAKSLYGKTISIKFPVSQQWLSKHRRTSNIGWAMILGGMFVFVFETVGYVFLMCAGTDVNSSNWMVFVLLAAPLVSIAGVASMFAFHKLIVTAFKITNEHAWIAKISPDFLESLPDWPG